MKSTTILAATLATVLPVVMAAETIQVQCTPSYNEAGKRDISWGDVQWAVLNRKADLRLPAGFWDGRVRNCCAPGRLRDDLGCIDAFVFKYNHPYTAGTTYLANGGVTCVKIDAGQTYTHFTECS
ncbi:hypothetical protein MPH_00191 [Macrophomina phaseolina MS6]|uniref:Uncharacterized protein n=2 Tax=Macrophomina phaseolina TaxID=35725 RepID=K2RIR4_MACPH|nr:hypothetical protein MPH_00191 [Macrophomina phaseolina MS6]KAH7015968.1 hypothetical protein B0J12DRAFT_790719 [Macrophomina phaseolina]